MSAICLHLILSFPQQVKVLVHVFVFVFVFVFDTLQQNSLDGFNFLNTQDYHRLFSLLVLVMLESGILQKYQPLVIAVSKADFATKRLN